MNDQELEKVLDDPECEDTFFLPEGTVFKLYPDRIWIRCSERFRDDPVFFGYVNDLMIQRYAGKKRFEAVRCKHGYDAAAKLVSRVIVDVEFFSE